MSTQYQRAAEKRAALIDEIDFLLSCGEVALSIAPRLGYTADALEKRCYRAGRNDLGALFGRVHNADQRAQRRSKRIEQGVDAACDHRSMNTSEVA